MLRIFTGSGALIRHNGTDRCPRVGAATDLSSILTIGTYASLVVPV
jgi:hypothetical protein